MKATSKLISVVLILAMCLSMFTISAFAEDKTITLTEPNQKVAVGGYSGKGASQASQNENLGNVQSENPVTTETVTAPANDGFVEVASANELQAALDAKSANIRLTAQFEWAGVLNLQNDVNIDLGGEGKGLIFTGAGDAAIFSSAKAVLYNGNIFVNGQVPATEEQQAVEGFKTVAASSEEGSVYLNGVYVKFTDEGANTIFGEGVSLGSGLFSQDVSGYYSESVASQYIFEQTESGMFDVTAKTAVPEETESDDENEPADSVEDNEGEDPSDEVVTVVGRNDEIGAVVTVSGKNLPEGLRCEVLPMDNSVLQVGEGEKVLFVVDITLYDEEGNVYEPEKDPNVPEVTVQIRHPALGNVEDGEAVTLYHIVKGEAVPVESAKEVAGEDALEFSTDSFSPYGATTTDTGSDGDVHYRVVTLDSVEIYVNGSGGLEISFTGGKKPESVSILPYEKAISGDYDTYKAYILTTDDYSFDDDDAPTKLTIKDDALKTAPDGKYGVVFWYMDEDTRVYMVQPVIIVNSKGVEGVGPNFTPNTIGDNSTGTFDVEMCDADSVKVKLTDELKEFEIIDGDVDVKYPGAKKNKITIDGKDYNASEFFSVEDYYATDPVGHEFVAGKVLILHQSLIKKLGFHDDDSIKFNVTQADDGAGEFIMNISPGITVADGLDDYIKGKNLWVKFQACAPIDYDSDGTLAIWIGGQKISHDYYSISNDHMTLWIYRNLLDQLKSNNRYTLTARLWRYVKDPVTGKQVKETYYPATASFNVLAAGSTSSKSPKTGDESNVALWASVLVLSGGAVIALIPKKKSRAR